MTTKITDHPEQAVARLIQVFRGKKRFEAVIRAFGRQVQELEDAFWQLLQEQTVDTAIGAQLDVLGRIVGERRGGSSDADYRLRIRARIRTNLSTGTIDDIYAVFRALLGSTPGYSFGFTPHYPAGFTLVIKGIAIAPSVVPIFVRFLRQARGAAIAAWFGWQETQDADAFTCSTSAFLSTASSAGDTSFTVYGSADFPASGVFVIDEGLATAEALAYTAKTATTLSGFAPASYPHAVNSNGSLAGTVGKGHGDEGDPTAGGALVGVVPA